MSGKKLIAMAVIGVVVVILVAFVVAPNLGGSHQTKFNVVEVLITTWSLNKTVGTPGIDVIFKISLDLTGDGTYESEPNSTVFENASIEVAPFKLGGPIDASITKFKFKVEVFKLVDNQWQQMYYTPNYTTPINEGTNEVEAHGSWSYDATGTEGANDLACMISYIYYVNFVS